MLRKLKLNWILIKKSCVVTIEDKEKKAKGMDDAIFVQKNQLIMTILLFTLCKFC